MSHKNLLFGISVSVMFCLLATTTVWAEECKKVQIGQTVWGPIEFGPENCNGYDGCSTATIHGTFNGTYRVAWYDADAVNIGDYAYAFTNYSVIETAHGELFLIERSVADFAAPNGFAVHTNVVDGTGRYAGAIGWIASFDSFEGGDAKWGGEVCWPDEDSDD